MESVDTFTLNLIDTYLKDKVKNPEFEESMMETLFRDEKYNLIIYASENGFEFNAKVISLMQQSGEIKLYQYLQDRGINLKIPIGQYRDLDAISKKSYMCFAIQKDRLDTVRWLYAQGVDYDMESLKIAVQYDRLDIVKWMDSIEFLEFSFIPPKKIAINYEIITIAMENGNLELLRWLYTRGNMAFTNYFEIIVKAGHLHVLKWIYGIYESKSAGFNMNHIFILACKYRNLDIMKWCLEHMPLFIHDIETAIKYGNLKFLMWIKEEYPDRIFRPELCGECVLSHSLECLKWLIENGCAYNLSQLKEKAMDPEIIAYLWALKE